MASALLGTEQRRCTVVGPELEFLAALQEVDREKDHEAWVLLASAYAATYRRAGQTPPKINPSQLPTPAPLETKPYCSPRVATWLAEMVEGNVKYWEPFVHEMLIALADKNRLVPPVLLPDLLTWGRRNKPWRAVLIRVVGERGQWLAQKSSEWKYSLEIYDADATEKVETVRVVSSQQAIYDALNITDNIFSKTLSVFKGQGPSSNSRMIDQIMDKVLALSKPEPGTKYAVEPDLVKIAVAVPPVILPELVSRFHKVVADGDTTWLSRFGDLLEFRHQMLEELANE